MRRSRIAAAISFALFTSLWLGTVSASGEDLVEGRWASEAGGVVEITATSPGNFVATVIRPNSGRCASSPGEQPYVFSGSFPDYVGTRTYSWASTCELSGLGQAVYRMRVGGLTLCSRAPDDGAPLLDDLSSDCTYFHRPGALEKTTCGAYWLEGGQLRKVNAARVVRRENRLTPAAYEVGIRGAECGFAERTLSKVLTASDERLSLQRAGLPFVTIDPDRVAGNPAYAIVAGNGGVTLTYRRIGAEPAPDPQIYRAGQQLIFGKRLGIPGGGCTGGFAVRLDDGATGALSAGHCGKDDDGSVRPNPYWYTGGPRRILGTIAGNLWPQGPDVLAVRIAGRWRAAPQIERGSRAPLTVVGVIPDAAQIDGLPVCFAGRVSGADQCGKISGSRRAERCTDIEVRKGDSGGPVYYAPEDGFTSAVGIVAIRQRLNGNMCFTPIETALAGLGARILTGA